MREPLCISPTGVWKLSDDIHVCSVETLPTVDLDTVSLLIINLSDWQTAYWQLQQIRSHVNPKIYLKPVLFYGTPDGVPREVIQTADGMIRTDEDSLESYINTWSSKVESINVRIQQLQEISPDGDGNIAFKVLRFIFTRNINFKALPSASRTSGYLYPRLQPLFPREDVGVLETLEYLESQNFLSGQFIIRSYACTHCGCAFLNFFETCPDCGSSDLSADELIHHFKCAYVGEMADFRREDKLICPKCDKVLKHIGVDYDKASVIYHCRACSNVFQEPMIMTSCYDCWRETEPENQMIRDIKSYAITSIGENAACYGMDSLLQTILEAEIHALSFDVFNTIFKLEVARIERYKLSQSCLVLLRIQGIDQIYGRMGRRATEIFQELSETLKTGLRSSDIFAVRDETIFLIIMTETPEENAELAVSRLKERILSLLLSNLKMEFKIDKVVHPMSNAVDLEKTIEDFLQTNVD